MGGGGERGGAMRSLCFVLADLPVALSYEASKIWKLSRRLPANSHCCLCDDRMIGDTFREHVRILTSKERRLRATTDRTRQGNPRPKTEILTPHTNYTTARRAQSKSSLIFHFPLIFIYIFHSRSRDHHCMHVFSQSAPKNRRSEINCCER